MLAPAVLGLIGKVEASGFRFLDAPMSNSAREVVPVVDLGSTTSYTYASPIWSGFDQINGGARNEVPQEPRKVMARSGRQVMPTLGLKLPPASL